MKLTVQDLAMFIGGDVEIQHAGFPENYKQFFAKIGDVVKVEPILLLTISQGYVKVKPILRPLSDMTEDEIMECFDMAGFDRDDIVQKEYDGENPIKIRDNEISIRTWGKTSHEYDEWDIYAAHIKMGEIVDYMGCPPNNWREIFVWFIQKQFDVFNWIEKGLAIDKTKGIH